MQLYSSDAVRCLPRCFGGRLLKEFGNDHNRMVFSTPDNQYGHPPYCDLRPAHSTATQGLAMTLEEKIKESFIKAAKASPYYLEFAPFKQGYLAAIEDIKAGGPVAITTWRADGSIGVTWTLPRGSAPLNHDTPLYRLED